MTTSLSPDNGDSMIIVVRRC